MIMGFKGWYNSQDVLVKAGVASGLVTGVLGLLGVVITVSVTLATSGSQPSSQSNSTSSRSAAMTPSASPTTAHPSTTQSLNFYNVTTDEKVGPMLQALLVTGVVPTGERAWILVESSGSYYVQGMLQRRGQSSNVWDLPTVSFGSAQGPINEPYTIYIILADSGASIMIQTTYKNTGFGNNGVSQIPGGSGAKEVRKIAVIRTH